MSKIKHSLKKYRSKLIGIQPESVGRTEEYSAKTASQTQDTHQFVEMMHGIQLQTDRKLHNSGILPISESEIVAKIFNGQKVYLDPRDLAVTPHLALDGIWEQEITKAWLHVLNDTDTVLDIGANFGYYGIIAANVTSRSASNIIMFEANSDLIPFVEKTLSVNWLRQHAKVENLAVSDTASTVTLNILKDYLGSSSLQDASDMDAYLHDKMKTEVAKTQQIAAVSIDDYCKQNGLSKVNLIKMDIEGYEDIAYKGMRKTVAANDSLTLFIEFTKQAYKQPEEFFDQMLTDFGHLYTISDEGSLNRVTDSDYGKVVGAHDDWVMLVFSKNAELAVE